MGGGTIIMAFEVPVAEAPGLIGGVFLTPTLCCRARVDGANSVRPTFWAHYIGALITVLFPASASTS